MNPSSSAFSTARVRSRTPSFDMMLDAWFFTVPSAVPNVSAISRLVAARDQAKDFDFASGQRVAGVRFEVGRGALERA
jgi:hypothetical protein